jgi:hypothetical protein
MGNDSQEFRRSPETWIYQFNTYIPNDTWLVPFWWTRLTEDPLFRNRVKERWQELRAEEWSNGSLQQLIDDLTFPLIEDGAVDRNFEKWDIFDEQIFGNPSPLPGSNYEEEVAYMSNWLQQRLVWMDAEISGW